jgi:NAD(P)-dependent dehydrogenase (short-subunit alcohol dehydrogenase family)
VNISSLAGESGGIVVGVDYAASKGGLLALTKKLALEVAGFGINVNAIAPGTTRTSMTDALPEADRTALGPGFRSSDWAHPRTSPMPRASLRAMNRRSSRVPRSM